MNEIQELKREIEKIKAELNRMKAGHSIDLYTDQALQGRGFTKITGGLTGIIKANTPNPFTAIVPITGTGLFYVAGSPGASPTVEVAYNSGIITSIT